MVRGRPKKLRPDVALTDQGQQVRRLRAEQSLSLRELGRRSGISEATLSRIENGRVKNIAASTLEAIASALDVPTLTLTNPAILESAVDPVALKLDGVLAALARIEEHLSPPSGSASTASSPGHLLDVRREPFDSPSSMGRFEPDPGLLLGNAAIMRYFRSLQEKGFSDTLFCLMKLYRWAVLSSEDESFILKLLLELLSTFDNEASHEMFTSLRT